MRFPTGEDRDVFVRKLGNPEQDIACPSCGEPLAYIDGGTAWEVRCEKCGLHIAVKGF